MATLMVTEQWAPLRFEKLTDTEDCPCGLLYDVTFQPRHGDSAPDVNTHTIYADSCNALPAGCKLKPAYHLQSFMQIHQEM